eukprot:GHVR01009624.1.p1 GENE.GHVR01009624.1~~GHVR01009624.1.p1  ORF type:complete len:819 (+),score=92.90 GHVR01009624.1:289-2745(+)
MMYKSDDPNQYVSNRALELFRRIPPVKKGDVYSKPGMHAVGFQWGLNLNCEAGGQKVLRTGVNNVRIHYNGARFECPYDTSRFANHSWADNSIFEASPAYTAKVLNALAINFGDREGAASCHFNFDSIYYRVGQSYVMAELGELPGVSFLPNISLGSISGNSGPKEASVKFSIYEACMGAYDGNEFLTVINSDKKMSVPTILVLAAAADWTGAKIRLCNCEDVNSQTVASGGSLSKVALMAGIQGAVDWLAFTAEQNDQSQRFLTYFLGGMLSVAEVSSSECHGAVSGDFWSGLPLSCPRGTITGGCDPGFMMSSVPNVSASMNANTKGQPCIKMILLHACLQSINDPCVVDGMKRKHLTTVRVPDLGGDLSDERGNLRAATVEEVNNAKVQVIPNLLAGMLGTVSDFAALLNLSKSGEDLEPLKRILRASLHVNNFCGMKPEQVYCPLYSMDPSPILGNDKVFSAKCPFMMIPTTGVEIPMLGDGSFAVDKGATKLVTYEHESTRSAGIFYVLSPNMNGGEELLSKFKMPKIFSGTHKDLRGALSMPGAGMGFGQTGLSLDDFTWGRSENCVPHPEMCKSTVRVVATIKVPLTGEGSDRVALVPGILSAEECVKNVMLKSTGLACSLCTPVLTEKPPSGSTYSDELMVLLNSNKSAGNTNMRTVFLEFASELTRCETLSSGQWMSRGELRGKVHVDDLFADINLGFIYNMGQDEKRAYGPALELDRLDPADLSSNARALAEHLNTIRVSNLNRLNEGGKRSRTRAVFFTPGKNGEADHDEQITHDWDDAESVSVCQDGMYVCMLLENVRCFVLLCLC